MLKKFREFINCENTVIIRNENDYLKLKKLLARVGITLRFSYAKCKELAIYNRFKDPSVIILEYEPEKGFAFCRDIKDSISWYGMNPYEVSELFE